MKNKRNLLLLSSLIAIIMILGIVSCRVHYGFNDVSIPADVKTVKVVNFGNKARYVNPQLSPRVTERLRQKIVGQTRLTQINGDDADWEITGDITEYTVTTSAISGQRESGNRLVVSAHIVRTNKKTDEVVEYDVTRNFEFGATETLQDAERRRNDDIIRDLTDDMFNRLFSNW